MMNEIDATSIGSCSVTFGHGHHHVEYLDINISRLERMDII